MMVNLVLGTALIISFFTDIKNRKILNVVTLPAVAFGLVYYTLTQGLDGFFFSGKGFLVGFGLLLIPFLIGGMGAGDVKLMAAIGALMGASFVLNSFVYIALIGGLISFFVIIKNKGIWNSIKSIFINVVFLKGSLGSILLNKNKESSLSFPYGVAIVLGTVCTFIWGGFL